MLALLLTGCAADASAANAKGAAAQVGGVPLTIAFNAQAPGPAVPARFLGLSFEAAALTQLGGYAERGDLVTLLRSLGPGVLRFGGITSDENVAWSEGGAPPPWASSTIGPAQLRAIGRLARRSGWRVLLTVGLAHYEPQAAAAEVAAARRALGPYLQAVEIGNEPEAYANHGFRSPPWLPQEYEEEVSDYREVIAARSPGVPIAGPDSTGSGSFMEWGYAEGLAQAPVLLTGHHYPLGCSQSPSIEALLSPAMRGREQKSLETYMAVSRLTGIPLRIDEAGTVSCGGVPGISNTFASALWASGYITQAMADGAAGINLEGNPNNCGGYTPVCAVSPAAAAAGRLTAEPSFYALLMARSLVGYRPLPTTLTGQGEPNVQALALLGPRRTVKLLVCDYEPSGSPLLDLSVGVGSGPRRAQVLSLAGPGQQATAGVTLGERRVPASGSWPEPRRLPAASVRGGYVSLSMAPSTAVLVTVTPAAPKRRALTDRAGARADARQPALGAVMRMTFQPAFRGARK
jgi:hypothetical protein